MKTRTWCATVACGVAVVLLGAPRVQADEIPKKYREHVDTGLKWLAAKQNADGSWDANGQHKAAMTALAGMALLMEGSTIKDGKYSKNIEKATAYLMKISQKGNQRDG